MTKGDQDQLQEAEAFSHRVAHDLSGITQNVKAYVKRAIKKSGDPEAQLKYLERIIECADLSLEIIKGIYQLSGLSRNELVSERGLLSSTVESSLKIISEKISECNGLVEVVCPHYLVHSKDLMILVFQNLIGNALKFSAIQGTPKVKVSSEKIDDHTWIHIEDNGPGIPEEHRDKIFQAFQRLHGDDVPGHGIGLNIVAKVLDKHGASIDVGRSESLGGAKFSLKFP